MADEPKFLTAPPRPPVPRDVEKVIADAARQAVDQALPGVIAAAAGNARRRWNDDARPPRVPVEHRMGGMSVTVPSTWQEEPPDPRGKAWIVRDRACVSLTAHGFTKQVPPLDAFLAARPDLGTDGYLRIGLAPLAHGSGLPAAELCEVAAGHPARPIRYLRCLRHPAAIVILKLDADGEVPAEIGGEYAAAFASIAFR